jgi:hypothetical protein
LSADAEVTVLRINDCARGVRLPFVALAYDFFLFDLLVDHADQNTRTDGELFSLAKQRDSLSAPEIFTVELSHLSDYLDEQVFSCNHCMKTSVRRASDCCFVSITSSSLSSLSCAALSLPCAMIGPVREITICTGNGR